jgi:hypothetical protein
MNAADQKSQLALRGESLGLRVTRALITLQLVDGPE